MPDRIQKPRYDDPSRQKASKRFRGRRLMIRGEEWLWSGVDTLRIQDPTGKTHRVCLTEFSGHSWYSLERMSWKKPAYAITPGRIVDFINRRILGYTDRGGFPSSVLPENFEAIAPAGANLLRGPRGVWHWWIEEQYLALQSPEGIRTTHKIAHILEMSESDFVSLRVAAAKAALNGFDPTIDIEWIHQAVATPCLSAPNPGNHHVSKFLLKFAAAPHKEAA